MNNGERPRLIIAAAHSSSGKTTVTCGIITELVALGLRVHPYKIGPDYIDPGYLGLAAGLQANNLDTWLTDDTMMKKIFVSSSKNADISIIEGVMGLYDGGRNGISSTAQISKLLRAPVLLVIDVSSMGDSAAAIAKGFRDYDTDVDIRGVIINRYGSENHKNMVCEAIERKGIPVFGAVPRKNEEAIRERHLGLLPVDENKNFERNKNVIQIIRSGIDFEALIKIAQSAPPFEEEVTKKQRERKKIKIAIARDEAFSFYYPESIAVLEASGAEIICFSPIHDEKIPECHGLIFGGGFPEMFAAKLADNFSMKEAIVRAAENGMPIYAECGGFMYLTREIKDFDNKIHKMTGVIPMNCKMNNSLRTVGYVTAKALTNNVIALKGEELRGHEFHFSNAEKDEGISPAFVFTKNRSQEKYIGGFANKNILGSYLHIHFAGFPKAADRFVERCTKYKLHTEKYSHR